MIIEQIKWRREDLWDLMVDDDVYYVRVNYRTEKNSDEILPHPYGVSFNRVNNAKIKELLPLLESGEVGLVRVKKD